MRRILSFHGFNFVLLLGIGFTTDCICAYTALDYLQQELIRENPSARQAQTNQARHNKKSVKEQIRRIRVIRDIFLNMASEPKASERINGVLSSRQLTLHCW